jgi:hypothetical protein
VDEDTIYNFLDELHPCEEALLHYLGDVILAGKVAFTSQWKKLPGAKNFRTFEQMEFREEKGTIQLLPIGNITGCSTALATLKNASESVLIDFNHATLMQKHAMMARGTDRPLRLCSISLCGIDLTTELANKVFNKSIVPVDAQSISVTDAAAKGTGDQVFFSNLTTNHEQHAEKLQHAPKLVQKAVATIMRYDKLQEMLPYIHYTKGIDENVSYIEAFKNEFAARISPEDCKRLDVHLRLMAKVQKLHESGTLDALEILLDTIAVFAMLCTVYNELILKYDTNKKYANIIVPINCASGKNRTGAVIAHCMSLSRTADIIVKKFGIDELENLLDPKYYPLRRAVGNDQAKKGLIGKDNGRRSTLGAEGIREQSESSISRIDVAKSVRKRMCSPAAEFKGLMANVYIPNKDRIDIFRDATLKEIILNKENDIAAKEKAYRNIIARYSIFSILYTLRNLRAPGSLKWLPAVDAELIHTILIEKVEASAFKGILVQDNLGLYLPPIQTKVPVRGLAVDEKVVPVMPDNPSSSIQPNSEIMRLSDEKNDLVPVQPDEKKASLKQIILGKMAALVPKEIGLIQKHLGLHFFSEQPKNDVKADSMIQDNPCPSFPSIQSNEIMVLSSEKTGLVGSSHPTRQDEKTQSLPQEHQKKKGNPLKIGSIIAGLFVVLAPIIAYVELHAISLFATVTLTASAMTGWWYAHEEESDKKKDSVYKEQSNQTFFSGQPKPVVNRDPEKHTILRRY